MADPITIGVAATGLFFAALTAGANISSACTARRNENEMRRVSNGVQRWSITTQPQDFKLVPYNAQQIPSQLPSGSGHMAQQGQKLGGWVVLEKEQQSRDTLPDTRLGMHTGRMPGYNQEMAEKHWFHFQSGSIDPPRTIAVVNWSESLITMYEYLHSWKLFFRNYHVVLLEADMNAFAVEYYNNEVFSGIMKDTWLHAHNSYLRKVSKPWWRRIFSVRSSNSWRLLGIKGDIRGDPVFMEMKRAALFGIIESRFQDPTLLNVDMVGHKRVQFVKLDTEYSNLVTKGNSAFSVFSFSNNGWAEDSVLVG